MRTWCLSIHAGYRCRHQGACCQADWGIEVDDRLAKVVQSGRFLPLTAFPQPFASVDDQGVHARTVARTGSGDCVFHRESRCSLHVAGGEALLPSACRHFPRVMLLDPRGCFLTLSHFCPTAAALLLEDVPVRIVDAAPPLALSEPLEGLDARTTLPPLLHPQMLMDLEGYAAWEESAVTLFATAPSASDALARLASATERIRAWTPSEGSLKAFVSHAFAAPGSDDANPDLSRGFEIARTLTGPHPDMVVPHDFERRWTALENAGTARWHRIIARYMAAVTFGNWMAYRGQGLRSVVEWLRACFDVLRVQIVRLAGAGGLSDEMMIKSIRQSDYLLVHTVDSAAFGRAAAAVER